MIDEQDVFGRWTQRLNRDMASRDYEDKWRTEQCFNCQFYLPLAGSMGADFGACANSDSKFDKVVMFEHDGCEQHRCSGY